MHISCAHRAHSNCERRFATYRLARLIVWLFSIWKFRFASFTVDKPLSLAAIFSSVSSHSHEKLFCIDKMRSERQKTDSFRFVLFYVEQTWYQNRYDNEFANASRPLSAHTHTFRALASRVLLKNKSNSKNSYCLQSYRNVAIILLISCRSRRRGTSCIPQQLDFMAPTSNAIADLLWPSMAVVLIASDRFRIRTCDAAIQVEGDAKRFICKLILCVAIACDSRLAPVQRTVSCAITMQPLDGVARALVQTQRQHKINDSSVLLCCRPASSTMRRVLLTRTTQISFNYYACTWTWERKTRCTLHVHSMVRNERRVLVEHCSRVDDKPTRWNIYSVSCSFLHHSRSRCLHISFEISRRWRFVTQPQRMLSAQSPSLARMQHKMRFSLKCFSSLDRSSFVCARLVHKPERLILCFSICGATVVVVVAATALLHQDPRRNAQTPNIGSLKYRQMHTNVLDADHGCELRMHRVRKT